MLFDEKIKEVYKDYIGKVCVITGIEGFIGKHLAQRLIEIGAIVYGYDIKLTQDICNMDQLNDYLDGIIKPDYVFHLAALTEVVDSYNRPYEYHVTNFLGTLNVLEQVKQRKISSLVIASTDKVYGGSTNSGYQEINELVSKCDPYSHSKRIADLVAQSYWREFNLPLKILRSVNTYGPGQTNTTTLITNTINLLLSGNQPVSYEDALVKLREWLYIDDAIQAYLLAGLSNTTLKNWDNYGYVFNIGSGEYHTPIVIINKIIEQLKIKDKAIKLVRDDKRATCHQFVDCRLFTNFMKRINPLWKPTNIDEGLSKTIEWHKDMKIKNGTD